MRGQTCANLDGVKGRVHTGCFVNKDNLSTISNDQMGGKTALVSEALHHASPMLGQFKRGQILKAQPQDPQAQFVAHGVPNALDKALVLERLQHSKDRCPWELKAP